MMRTGGEGVQRGGGRVLAILLAAYIFNFLDRQIVGILAEPIKAELGLSDSQLGLMGGLAFALFYTGLGIPVALLADRFNRVTIISISLGLWSAFTALCGTAQGFWQLFLYRMGVGVGEAGGVAPSYSVITDSFPPQQRARALAIFSFGVPIGTSLGVYFGGIVAAHVDWRAAFIAVGLAGVLLVPLVKLGVPEPVRGCLDRAAGTAPPPPPAFGTVFRTFAAKPSFWLLAFGSACSSILGYGLAFWLPSLLARSYGLELVDRSLFYGTVALIGGVAGVWLGGWLGDKLGARHPSGYARVPAICFLIAAPTYAVAIFAPSVWAGFFLFLIPAALALAWLGPVNAAIQHLVPPEMRATTSASFLFINNLLGIGFGTWFLGFMSDRMAATYGEESLRWSILYSLSFYLLGALLYLLAARRLERDWHRA